jgi:hypothetical protein
MRFDLRSKRGKGNVFALVVKVRDGHESSALRVHCGELGLRFGCWFSPFYIFSLAVGFDSVVGIRFVLRFHLFFGYSAYIFALP